MRTNNILCIITDCIKFYIVYKSNKIHWSLQTPKPEDLGVFLDNEDIRMIRWVGGETTALKQMQQRLAVEHETFLRYKHNIMAACPLREQAKGSNAERRCGLFLSIDA